MGFLSSITSSITGDGLLGALGGITDAATGGYFSDQQTKASAKRQYNYNVKLQNANQAFQKYMAENAHQMEMADLQAAGLNPALTVTGSSAGSIAGSSAAQGTAPGANGAGLSGIVNDINNTRMTNANVKLANANASKAKAEENALDRGGFTQYWLGGGSPINSAKEKINEKANKIKEKERKEESKEYNETADKFDNFWGN